MSRPAQEVLGTMTYPSGLVATLHVDGSWSVPGREWLEPTLRAIYSDYGGPQEGPFGAKALADLARDVGGTFDFPDRPKPPPGTVY
jgi:hypothetical protein